MTYSVHRVHGVGNVLVAGPFHDEQTAETVRRHHQRQDPGVGYVIVTQGTPTPEQAALAPVAVEESTPMVEPPAEEPQEEPAKKGVFGRKKK